MIDTILLYGYELISEINKVPIEAQIWLLLSFYLTTFDRDWLKILVTALDAHTISSYNKLTLAFSRVDRVHFRLFRWDSASHESVAKASGGRAIHSEAALIGRV